jgi:hypothetical protein
MTRTTLLAAIAITLLAFVASGCGSSGSGDDGVAALDTGASAASGDGSTTPRQTEQDPQEAALAWATCMREHGVDVPDPQVDEDGRVQIRPGSGGAVPRRDSTKFREAMEACGSPFGDAGPPQLSDEEREQLQESLLEFAQCMREHGIDMPDPEFSGGGGLFRVGPGGGVDPDDPDFQEAQEACGSILQDARGRFGRSGSDG